MHLYDASLDEILQTLKSTLNKNKTPTKPTNDHSLCDMSNKSRSKKSAVQEDRSNVFEKLYSERILLKNRKMKLQYETKRSREEEEKQYCTFSPNIRSRMSTTPTGDDSFYLKNLEWQERKNKEIKKQQCERNEQKLRDVTLTPRINQYKYKENNSETITKKSGVVNFLNRLKKAKDEKEYVSYRKNVPNSHTWNIKRGLFSQIK